MLCIFLCVEECLIRLINAKQCTMSFLYWLDFFNCICTRQKEHLFFACSPFPLALCECEFYPLYSRWLYSSVKLSCDFLFKVPIAVHYMPRHYRIAFPLIKFLQSFKKNLFFPVQFCLSCFGYFFDFLYCLISTLKRNQHTASTPRSLCSLLCKSLTWCVTQGQQ